MARSARQELAQERAARARAEASAETARQDAERARRSGVEVRDALCDAFVRLMVRLGFKGLVERVADMRGQPPPKVLLDIVEDYLGSSEGAWCMTCQHWHDPDIPMCVPDGSSPNWLTAAMRMFSAGGGHLMMDRHLAQSGLLCSCDDGYTVDDDGELVGCQRCRELTLAVECARQAGHIIEAVLEHRRRQDWDFERGPCDDDSGEWGGLI